jgi:hypothetical protein
MGAIMNSWKSRLLAACAPPLTTLKWGTGNWGVTPVGVSACHRSRLLLAAWARYTAIETPMMAFAPSRLLLSVPSVSRRI